MSRLIDADKLKPTKYEVLVKSLIPYAQDKTALIEVYDACDVDDAPTLDAVKHGHWTEVQRYGDNVNSAICECSVCKDTVWVYLNSERKWNYCPHCGARMDGDENEID